MKENVLKQLNNVVLEMSSIPSLFSMSLIDFSRNRIFNFKTLIIIILGFAGKSLNKELYDYFKNDTVIPTKSAFVQARAKILPEAFQFLFNEFNNSFHTDATYKGYQLLALWC